MNKAVVTTEMVEAFERAINGVQFYKPEGIRVGLQMVLNAGLLSLPTDTSKIREEVVREAIALFDDTAGYMSYSFVRERLQSLLPTIDEAEKLAGEYAAEKMGGELTSEALQPLTNFARWLLSRKESGNG